MKLKVVSVFILASVMLIGTLGLVQAQTEEPAEEGQEYIVQADDWLSRLAERFYGDPLQYPTIVDATNAKAAEDDSFTVIDNPDIIEIGQKLWIPDVSGSMMMTGTETMTATETMTSTETMTGTEMMTETEVMTSTETMTGTETMTETETMTGTETMTSTEAMTDTQ